MKEVTFISNKETLKQTLSQITPKFDTLLSLIPQRYYSKLGVIDRAYCQNSFVFPNDVTYDLTLEEPPKTIEGLLEETVRQLLTRLKKSYVQCMGQQYKDFHLQMKSLNFGRTIMETNSTFKALFSVIPYNLFFQILLNYIIIVPYKGEYIQVAGRALNQKYNMKAVGGIQRKVTVQAQQTLEEPAQSQANMTTTTQAQQPLGVQANQTNISQRPLSSSMNGPQSGQNNATQTNFQNRMMPKSYSYSSEHLHRMQMFYCSAMNRLPGLFAKNIFFDKGQKKSIFINEIGHLIKTCLQDHFKKKMNIPDHRISALTPFIKTLFQSVRQLFHYYTRNGKATSKFSLLLTRYCPLPSNYRDLKSRVISFVNSTEHKAEDVSNLFNDLYSAASDYKNVVNLVRQCIRRAVPGELMGSGNKQVLMRMMGEFVEMKRFQNFKMQELLAQMDVFELHWLQINYNHKHHKKIIIRLRKYLSLIVALIVNELVVPIIKLNFYVTEKHKEANRIFYYRKPLWTLISKVALKKFSEENLEPINHHSVLKLKKNLNVTYPEGKLRILPKKGTFRPIITFNRKVEFMSETNPTQKLKATLNQILSDTQLVLRNLKNVLGEKFGYCIFDNRQIMRKYDAFIERWRQMDCPPLKYFTLDIKKCYDSIDTSLLLRFVQQTNYIEDLYLILKYNRLYRNKKPLFGKNSFTSYFNYKERVTAVGLAQDPMQVREQHKIPSINIFPSKQKLITKETIIKMLKKICDGSIVSYRKNYWLQKLGIPQGLNVSGVLCSLYFAYLEQQYVKVKTGLLMRLTDDYFYIGPEKEAVQVLDSLLLCANRYGFSFSEDKISKNFEHPILKKMSSDKEIVWIGKLINVQNLEVYPNFEMSEKVSYAMNVNLTKKNIKSFLKNKLKSLLTNHFSSYFKPKLFPFETSAKVVRLYTQISLQKFLPFIVKVVSTISNPQQLLIKVFKGAIHEFLLFACMLADAEKDKRFYHMLYVEVGQEIIAFFTRRQPSEPTFISLRKIFEDDCRRTKQKLQLGEF